MMSIPLSLIHIFLANYCVGFEQFLPYLLGEKDGQPKDAAWAEKLTGIDAEDVYKRQTSSG